MISGKYFVHQPRWYWIPVRVLLVSVLLALLTFAISLLLGIAGAVVVAEIRDSAPNLQFAYRRIAPLMAGVAGGITLVYCVALEIQHYRQSRALSGIERVS